MGTDEPTPSPTKEPTSEPTDAPTDEPTDEPTPSPTKEPTDEPTDKPTTPIPTTDAPTTPIPTVTETDEPTSGSWPTQRPTLKSAMKWEMIHPQYEGNDGELLWHVYYGDFSDDERFDKFRVDEKWDAKEIRPIISSDSKFKRYENEELYKEDEQTVPTGHKSVPSSHGMWLIIIFIALCAGFAYWYLNNAKGAETSRLLDERYVSYQELE